MTRSVVWFRDDLRTADNPALVAARDAGEVIAVFVFCEAQWREHGVGERRLVFLARTLERLVGNLGELGIEVRILDVGRFREVAVPLCNFVREAGATTLHFNCEYPLDEARRDTAVSALCKQQGIEVRRHHGGTILPPGSVLTAANQPYSVFTPFKRRWFERLSDSERQPLRTPQPQAPRLARVAALPGRFVNQNLGEDELWPAGEKAAGERLSAFVDSAIAAYHEVRDRPDCEGTSRLSPYLAVGAVSARQCFSAAVAAGPGEGTATWINELIWRDFYRHVAALFPGVSRGKPFREGGSRVAWRSDPAGLDKWKRGETGYPLVDAGMRELLATGWMHNRVRMVVAMFLTKHLLIDWHEGERHFMELLVDGDLAANNGGWQWSASTGTDAAPYFRIFNPVTQARRVDPRGVYVRRWVPELESVPLQLVFEPWNAPLETAGYPPRIVEHTFARLRALDTFKAAF